MVEIDGGIPLQNWYQIFIENAQYNKTMLQCLNLGRSLNSSVLDRTNEGCNKFAIAKGRVDKELALTMRKI